MTARSRASAGSPPPPRRRGGVVARATLRRLGVAADGGPTGTVAAGDWLVGPERAAALRTALQDLVRAHATPLSPGLPVPEAVRALGVPAAVVEALATDGLGIERGQVAEASATIPDDLQPAVDRLRAHLEPSPFAAPAADALREWGLDAGSVAALHRSGVVLRLADGVVLLPDAAERAVVRLADLEQPFTASEARQALGTSRRVVLPLLAHLDTTGRTLRLPDDTRRLR